MSEEVTPDQKVKITIEITGPKRADAMKKILEELQKVGKTYGFDVGKPSKERK